MTSAQPRDLQGPRRDHPAITPAAGGSGARVMDRRAFIGACVGSLLGGPLAAGAQQASTVKIGWLAPEPKPFALAPFRQVLKESGWIEGGNLVIEPRYAHGAIVRYQELAVELVRLRVDAIVTDGTPATRAAQQVTATIPIVFLSSSPVEQGFAESLPRPGKNLTGVAIIGGELNPQAYRVPQECSSRHGASCDPRRPSRRGIRPLEYPRGWELGGCGGCVTTARHRPDAPEFAEDRRPGRGLRACRK